eukprot:2743610-Prymnesium_polylepis.1
MDNRDRGHNPSPVPRTRNARLKNMKDRGSWLVRYTARRHVGRPHPSESKHSRDLKFSIAGRRRQGLRGLRIQGLLVVDRTPLAADALERAQPTRRRVELEHEELRRSRQRVGGTSLLQRGSIVHVDDGARDVRQIPLVEDAGVRVTVDECCHVMTLQRLCKGRRLTRAPPKVCDKLQRGERLYTAQTRQQVPGEYPGQGVVPGAPKPTRP